MPLVPHRFRRLCRMICIAGISTLEKLDASKHSPVVVLQCMVTEDAVVNMCEVNYF